MNQTYKNIALYSAFIAVVFGAVMLALRSEPRERAALTRTELEDLLNKHSESLFPEIQRAFPEEYETYLDDTLLRLNSGSMTKEEGFEYGKKFTEGLIMDNIQHLRECAC